MDNPSAGSLPHQLSLRLTLDEEATFDNFYLPPETGNASLVHYLKEQVARWAQPRSNVTAGTVLNEFVWMWGSTGAGCSHLLQAVCHQAAASDMMAFYLDLSAHAELDPSILLGLEDVSVLCLDKVDVIVGQTDWELALFNLYNRMAERQTPLLVASHRSPQHLLFALADLTSRLQSAVVFNLATLNDEQKALALQMRARRLGFELTAEVADFLVSRSERSMSTLFATLQRLDRHSMETQRKVTIPLLKSFMGW
jgi:DnaA-homolog protein